MVVSELDAVGGLAPMSRGVMPAGNPRPTSSWQCSDSILRRCPVPFSTWDAARKAGSCKRSGPPAHCHRGGSECRQLRPAPGQLVRRATAAKPLVRGDRASVLHLAPAPCPPAIGGACTRYVRRYMTILRALRLGGRFTHTPNLPFLEALLPVGQFAQRIRHIGYSTCVCCYRRCRRCVKTPGDLWSRSVRVGEFDDNKP